LPINLNVSKTLERSDGGGGLLASQEGKERQQGKTNDHGGTRVAEQWQGLAFWRAIVGDELSQIFAIAKGAAPRPGRVKRNLGLQVSSVASCFRRLGF
jgi:hypothetical protein